MKLAEIAKLLVFGFEGFCCLNGSSFCLFLCFYVLFWYFSYFYDVCVWMTHDFTNLYTPACLVKGIKIIFS